jgi:hypothetical protein
MVNAQANGELDPVRALLEACGELWQRQLAAARDAPAYNLFRLLDLERSEVRLHSRFIADLLDPYGTHGQGSLFLRLFLHLLVDKFAGAPPGSGQEWAGYLQHIADTLESTPRLGEWQIVREQERIDVSIRNPRTRLLIFIENKIDAAEQNNQLRRYRELLESYRDTYDWRLLLFIAPKNYCETTTGRPDIRVHYEDDVRSWIQQALTQVCSERVRAALAQYVQTISNLGNMEASMGPESDELLDLLCSKEYIHTTLRVRGAIAQVKPYLWQSLWSSIEQHIRHGLRRGQPFGDRHVENTSKGDPIAKEVGLQCAVRTTGSPRLLVGVWRAWDKPDSLYYGIAFDQEQPYPHPKEQIQALRQALIKDLPEANSWKVAWQWAPDLPEGNELLVEIAVDAVGVGKRAAGLVLAVLQAHGLEIKAADAAVAQS